MFCRYCGAADQAGAYCGQCGKPTADSAANSPVQEHATVAPHTVSNSEARVLANIRKYEDRAQLYCLECGYRGLAGITRRDKRTGARTAFWLFVIIPILLFSGLLAMLGFAIGGFTMFSVTTALEITYVVSFKPKLWVECPNCEREVGPLK